MRIIFLLLLLCCDLASGAQVYKCVKPDGAIHYRDKPCKSTDLQSILKYSAPQFTALDLKNLQHRILQQQQLYKAQKHKLRAQIRATKQQQLQEKRRLRLRARCETVMRQIDQLNMRYKRGYTATQGISLERKLAECKIKKAKFCN